MIISYRSHPGFSSRRTRQGASSGRERRSQEPESRSSVARAFNWRGAALDRPVRSRTICIGACVTETLLNRRLPRTFQRVIGLWPCRGNEQFPRQTLDKTSRAVASGSRLFNTIFWPSSQRKEYREIFRHDLKRLPSKGRVARFQPLLAPCLAHHHVDHAIRYNHNFTNGFAGGALFDFRGG